MKIAISSKGAGLGAWIEPDLKQAGFIVVVDEDGGFSAVEKPLDVNPDQIEREFIKSALQEDINVFIAGSLEADSCNLLRNKGVMIFTASKGSILELVEAYNNGQLVEME